MGLRDKAEWSERQLFIIECLHSTELSALVYILMYLCISTAFVTKFSFTLDWSAYVSAIRIEKKKHTHQRKWVYLTDGIFLFNYINSMLSFTFRLFFSSLNIFRFRVRKKTSREKSCVREKEKTKTDSIQICNITEICQRMALHLMWFPFLSDFSCFSQWLNVMKTLFLPNVLMTILHPWPTNHRLSAFCLRDNGQHKQQLMKLKLKQKQERPLELSFRVFFSLLLWSNDEQNLQELKIWINAMEKCPGFDTCLRYIFNLQNSMVTSFHGIGTGKKCCQKIWRNEKTPLNQH